MNAGRNRFIAGCWFVLLLSLWSGRAVFAQSGPQNPRDVKIIFDETKQYRAGETVPLTLKMTIKGKPAAGKTLCFYVSVNCKDGLMPGSRKVGEYKTDKSGEVKITDFAIKEPNENWLYIYFGPIKAKRDRDGFFREYIQSAAEAVVRTINN